MRDILSWLWKFLFGGGRKEEAMDYLRRNAPQIKPEDRGPLIDETLGFIDIANKMNDEPDTPLAEIPNTSGFDLGGTLVIDVQLGAKNPVTISTEYEFENMDISIQYILDAIFAGTDTFGLSPTLISRIIRYPESAKVLIGELWGKGFFGRWLK